MSYSLSLFSANKDDVGFGYNIGVVSWGTLDAKFCASKSYSMIEITSWSCRSLVINKVVPWEKTKYLLF